MKNNTPIKILLSLICIVVIYHLCVIAKIIPERFAWGGQLENDNKMYAFESASIIINLFLGFVLLMKGGYIKSYFNQKVIHIILWVFFILFILNTIGNLLARTNIEKIFSIMTLIFAVLLWVILKKQKD